MAIEPITLPHGLWEDGICRRVAVVRPLTGADELYLREQTQQQTPARRAVALLERCVVSIGNRPAGLATLRALPVGDREALLLRIRCLNFGPSMEAQLACPGCGERLDLNLQAEDLLLLPYQETAEWHHLGEVAFRLPNAGDMEEAALLAGRDSLQAATLIFERCIRDGQEALDQETQDHVAARMAELDPQAELTLQLCCPHCDLAFGSLLDAGAFVIEEIDRRARHLLRQVHQIARHYHWSEEDILALAPSRRMAYLELIHQEDGLEPSV